VKKGLPFREAYQKVSLSAANQSTYDKTKVLKVSKHTGGTGNLGLSKIEVSLAKDEKWWKSKQDIYVKAINNLTGEKNHEV